MKFGAVLNYEPELIERHDWEGLKKTAKEVEELGYDSLWVMDHFTYHGGPNVMECLATVTALAACTDRIRVGGLMTCNSFRHPPLVAKMAATIDVISGGRVNLGIGAGWKEDEYAMYGYNFPNNKVRIEQLGEAVQVIKKMWTGGGSFDGKYYQIRGLDFGPPVVQKPHPPIWIGGGGEKLTLRVVAEYADYSNLSQYHTMEEYAHKTDVLRQHCQAVGRAYDSIKKSLGLEVMIGKTATDAKLRQRHAHEDALKHGVQRHPDEQDLGNYTKKRLFGTPESCTSQLQDWLELDVDYVLVGWTMKKDDWKLFAEKVIPNFE
jgi:F420-dependent oxidoreductase-like protein